MSQQFPGSEYEEGDFLDQEEEEDRLWWGGFADEFEYEERR